MTKHVAKVDASLRTRPRSPERLHSILLSKFVQSIEIALKRRGMTQRDLALAIGMHESQLSEIMSMRRSLTLSTMARIAYGVGVEDIIAFPYHEEKMSEIATKRTTTNGASRSV